jgi:transposase-like protein
VQPEHLFESALRIDGVSYITAAQVAEAANVSRQTLWRWRRQGKVPAGQRFRDRTVLFTQDDFASVLQYANRIEPATPDNETSNGGET